MSNNKNEKNLLNEHELYLLNKNKKFDLYKLFYQGLLLTVAFLSINFFSKKAWAHEPLPTECTTVECSRNKVIFQNRVRWLDSPNSERFSKPLDYECRQSQTNKQTRINEFRDILIQRKKKAAVKQDSLNNLNSLHFQGPNENITRFFKIGDLTFKLKTKPQFSHVKVKKMQTNFSDQTAKITFTNFNMKAFLMLLAYYLILISFLILILNFLEYENRKFEKIQTKREPNSLPQENEKKLILRLKIFYPIRIGQFVAMNTYHPVVKLGSIGKIIEIIDVNIGLVKFALLDLEENFTSPKLKESVIAYDGEGVIYQCFNF